MTDTVVIGLVVVVAAGSFLAGWMARHAQAAGRAEVLHWRELEAGPVPYDWADDEEPAG